MVDDLLKIEVYDINKDTSLLILILSLINIFFYVHLTNGTIQKCIF